MAGPDKFGPRPLAGPPLAAPVAPTGPYCKASAYPYLLQSAQAAESPLSIAFEYPNVAGNAIIALVSSTFATPTSTVSDTLGNVYRQVFEAGVSVTIAGFQVFIATGIKAGANKVTVAGSAGPHLSILEAANLSASGRLNTTGLLYFTTAFNSQIVSTINPVTDPYAFILAVGVTRFTAAGGGFLGAAGYDSNPILYTASTAGVSATAYAVSVKTLTGAGGIQSAAFTSSPNNSNSFLFILAFDSNGYAQPGDAIRQNKPMGLVGPGIGSRNQFTPAPGSTAQAAPTTTQYYGEDAELLDQDDDDQFVAPDDPRDSIASYYGEDAELADSDDDEQPLSDDYQGIGDGGAQQYGDDAEQAQQDDDDAVPLDDAPQSAMLATYYGEDAELLDEDVDLAHFSGAYQQSDATQPFTDGWDHFLTEDDDQPILEDYQGAQDTAPLFFGDDAEQLAQDDDDQPLTDDYAGTQNGNAQYYGDDAEQLAPEDDDQAPLDDALQSSIDATQYRGEDAELSDEDWDSAFFGGTYQQQDAAQQSPDDTWDHWAADDDDQAPLDDAPQSLVPTAQYYGEDAELADSDDDEQVILPDDPRDGVATYYGEDAELEPQQDDDYDAVGESLSSNNNPVITLEDSWDHFTTDDDEQPVPDDAQLVDVAAPGAIQYYGEDAECADADQDDDEWIERSADVLGDSVPVAVYYGEDAERLDSDDDEQWPFDELSQPLPLAQQFFGDEAEQLAAEDDEQAAGDDYALLDNAAPFADEWDHFVTDDDDQPPPDEFQQPLGTAPQTDGWDHFAGDDDEQWTLDEVLVATVVTAATQSPEDAWDHWDQVEDDYLLDDVQLLTAPVPLLLYGIGISFVIANGIVTQQRIYRTIPPWRANASNAWLGYRHAWGGAIK